jgi:hypothetical protein
MYHFSFDTEALNQKFGHYTLQDPFTNDFRPASEPKTCFGIQELYIIGLMDILPSQEILDILKKHIPFCIYNKLVKYCLLENPSTVISWGQCKAKLDSCNVSACADELLSILDDVKPTKGHCKTFHINNNLNNITAIEPSHSNTEALVLDFMTSVYRRNVLAAIVKYILLRDIISKLSSSLLTPNYKGIFSHMLARLNQIVHENIIFSFNGANYDNYLLANPLILCLTKLNHKVFLYKKGSSISTIRVSIQRNILAKPSKNKNSNFPVNLYLKDIRFMVSAAMTLDRIGQLFNIKFKKLVFPYNKAISIEALKNTSSLNPHDDEYWHDSFTGKQIPLKERLNAQNVFEEKGFLNLYEYSNYYLTIDCVLLHSIVLTIFNTYLADRVNIFIRRNYSQSNLAYQELFIVQPSRQILHNLAPKKISHPFLNYVIKKGVTGGLCTSYVHNTIDDQTVINSHFAKMDIKLDEATWPSFQCPETLVYDKKPAGIAVLDIRSLYPSAACEPIPVNTPLIFTRLSPTDCHNLPNDASMLKLKSFCREVQTNGDIHKDYFKLINKPPPFYSEFNALELYLSNLPPDITIIRFQSSFTALGQLYFVQYPVDGFLVYTQHDKMHMKIIQYNSVYRHGHMEKCLIHNNDDQMELLEKTNKVKSSIKDLCDHMIAHFGLDNISFEYVELSECNYMNHKIPPTNNYICEYKKKYTYMNFLQNILNNKLTGFIVVKNLEIKHKNPIIGFLIQKAHYDLKDLSPYTQDIIHHFNASEKVVALHKTAEFMVISTFYFNFLSETFGFEHTPDIYHGVFFKFDNYLTNQIETKLSQRTEIKEKIKTEKNMTLRQNLEVQSELLKLCLNSCYGFTLCNLSSSKFKSFKNAQTLPRHKRYTSKIKSSIQLAPHVYLNEYYNPSQQLFETMLGWVGGNILFFSKIILLKRLYYVLKHMNPCKAQLLYMDTDSAHILIHHEVFEDNIDDALKESFHQLYYDNFEGEKLAGIWVNEGFFRSAKYIGEKCYVLYGEKTVSHMKGLSNYFQTRFVNEKIDTAVTPFIQYNIFQRTPDFLIFKTNCTKNLFVNYLPSKRYFVCASGSLPLKIGNS